MINLNKQSRLVRFAYWFEPNKLRNVRYTTLCAFFWRAFFVAPLVIILPVTWAGCMLYLIGDLGWHHPRAATLLLLACGLIALYILKFHQRARHSVFIQGAKGVKAKFCPIIIFDKDDEED